jgi:dienelactone hydrolase
MFLGSLRWVLLLAVAWVTPPGQAATPVRLAPPGPALPGTVAWEEAGDAADQMVAGVDRFLNRKLAEAPSERDRRGWPGTRSRVDYEEGLRPLRSWLAERLGAVEARVGAPSWEWVSSPVQDERVGGSSLVEVRAIRWRAFAEVQGEGLLLEPVGREPVADVVAVPDADLTPEALVGMEGDWPGPAQFARRLAESGCRVLVPHLVDRRRGQPKVDWDEGRGRNLNNREFLHRPAFVMGRTLVGYEVLKVQAALDLLARSGGGRPMGVWGWGEGGRVALYAGALDPRVTMTGVSGAFGPREEQWREPLDRNLFGVLSRLGDAEVAALVAPRGLMVEASRWPEVTIPGDGGAPGRLETPDRDRVRKEWERAEARVRGLPGSGHWAWVESEGGGGDPGSALALRAFLEGLKPGWEPAPEGERIRDRRRWVDGRARADRQRAELDRHTQGLLRESGAYRERAFREWVDAPAAERSAIQARYRQVFAESVIGQYDDLRLPLAARSRQAYDTPGWTGYEVAMDVFPDVMAHGVLLVPKDLKAGERRPVVVFQHGLEGRPEDTLGEPGFGFYQAISARLAEEGWVVWAPQNLYLFGDRFRVLQRKANPLGNTLFSIIVPQHQQMVDWLGTLPFVAPDRIGFYGLSYGGKTAMRVPPLVSGYALSVCSADFNEWVDKNASTRSPYSYVWTGEYEIFEWNLGHTFNYAEMALLLAPRPFMVERGHFDGVAADPTVAYEFAKVRQVMVGRWGLPADHCQIEWFNGPHRVNADGVRAFLLRHLGAPRSE